MQTSQIRNIFILELVHGVDLAHPVGLRTLARQPDVLTEICWEVEGEMVDRREGDGLDFVLQGLS